MKFSIGRKLIIGVVAILLLMEVIIITGKKIINRLDESSQEILTKSEEIESVQDLRLSLLELTIPAHDYIFHHNSNDIREFKIKYAVTQDKLNKCNQLISTPSSKRYFDRFEVIFLRVGSIINEMMTSDESAGQTFHINQMKKMDGIVGMAIHELDLLVSTTKLEMDELNEQNQAIISNGKKNIMLIGIGTILFGLVGGFIYVRKITIPLKQLAKATKHIISGNLKTVIKVGSTDEVGSLARSFNEMTDTLNKTTVSRNYFNNIIKSIIDTVIVSDSSGEIKIANPATLALLGYKEDEIIGQPLETIFPLEYKNTIFNSGKLSHQMAKEGFIKNIETQYQAKSKKRIPVIFSSSILRYNDNNVKGVVCIAQDISKLKLAEENLQLSNDILREIGTLVIVSDVKGDIIYTSPSVNKITGHTSEELLNNGWWDLTFPGRKESERRKKIAIQLAQGILQAGDELFERKVKCKNGDGKWFLWHNSRSMAGLAISVGHDISDRRKFEKALKKEKKFNEVILSTIPDGLDIVDEDWNVIFMNPSFLTIFGKNAIGRKCYKVYKDNNKACHNCSLKKKIAIGQTRISVVSGMANKRTFEISQTGLLLPDGKKAILEVFKDITDHEKAKTELKTRNKELETFLYRASHDLKGPLSSMDGIVSMAKEECTERGSTYYLNLIDKAIEKLDDTLLDLLHIAMIKQGDILIEPINLEELVQEIISNYSNHPNYKTIDFKLDLPRNNDFYSDRKVLNILLRNLIENSIKYSRIGTEDPYIKVVLTEKEGNSYTLTISDNGIGIPLKYHKRIFDMFYRANEQSKGSGLGLYIVKNGVEELNGSIEIKSKKNKGTTFTISLPKPQLSIAKNGQNAASA